MNFLAKFFGWLSSLLARAREWLSALVAGDGESGEDWDGEEEAGADEDRAASLPARALHPLETLICTPRRYEDARFAVQSLKDGKVVILRLMEVDEGEGQRIVDFVSGAVFLLHADMMFSGENVLICAPDTVRVERGDYQFRVAAAPVFRRI